MSIVYNGKKATKAYYGDKKVREITVGNKVKYYLDSASEWNVDIPDWIPEGWYELKISDWEITRQTSQEFVYQNNNNKQTVSGISDYTDAVLEGLQEVEDESTIKYKFKCANYNTVYLPQWMRDKLLANKINVTCTLTSTINLTTTVNRYLLWGTEHKPGETVGYIVLRKGASTSGYNAVSSSVSSGKPGNKTSPYSSSGSGTVSQTITLDSNTTNVTWACLFNCIRYQGSRSTDSKHSGSYTNTHLTFTITPK